MTDALRCVYCVSDRGWGPFRLRICVRSPVALDAICLSPCGLGMVVGIGQRQFFGGSYYFARASTYTRNWDFAWTERRAFWVSIGLAVFSDAERFLGAVLVSISELRHWGPERVRPENLANGSSIVFGLRIGSRDNGFRTGDRFAAEEKILCLMAPVCFRIVRPSKSNLFRESHFNAHFVYISKLGPPLLKKGTRFGSKRRTCAGRSFGALTDTLGPNTLRTNSFLFSFQGLGRTQLRLS